MGRAAWATIEGLVDLELAHPPDADLDATYAAAARAYTTTSPGALN